MPLLPLLFAFIMGLPDKTRLASTPYISHYLILKI
jgi:hypothetical protein